MKNNSRDMNTDQTIADFIRDLIEERDEALSRVDELANKMVYRGNSVSYIYSKADDYKATIMEVWDALKEIGYPPDGATSCADMIRKIEKPRPKPGLGD